MATEPTALLSDISSDTLPRCQPRHGALVDYWALTKPDINLLIAVTVLDGFCLATATPFQAFPFVRLVNTIVGTSLVAGGAGALNQFMERGFDAQMRRTSRRPLSEGRVSSHHALWFGIALSVSGFFYLSFAVNQMACLLAGFSLVTYLALYTPLKRKTALCTLVGAVPGAIPPLIGWAAASGTLSPGAWILFGIVFLWQFPHFMAIAWIYREDYDRAGYRILPGREARNRIVALQSVLPAVALIPISMIPTLLGHAGVSYTTAVALLGIGFLFYGVRLALCRSSVVARQLLTASIVYLPSVFLLMLSNRR